MTITVDPAYWWSLIHASKGVYGIPVRKHKWLPSVVSKQSFSVWSICLFIFLFFCSALPFFFICYFYVTILDIDTHLRSASSIHSSISSLMNYLFLHLHFIFVLPFYFFPDFLIPYADEHVTAHACWMQSDACTNPVDHTGGMQLRNRRYFLEKAAITGILHLLAMGEDSRPYLGCPM